MTFTRIIAFIKLGRLIFSLAGFILYGFGAALAHYFGQAIDWQLYLWGQVIVTSTQLMVHYSNDYFDYRADVANATPTYWSGGSRVLPQGDLPLHIARNAALFFGGLALVLALLLISFYEVGALTLPLLWGAILLSWSYTAPPLRLNAHSLGEIAGVMVVALLTPLTGYYLQAGDLHLPALLAFIPLMFAKFNMLVGVHIPDMEGDQIADKWTLVARFGRERMAKIYILMLIGLYLSLPLLIALGLPTRIAAGATLPLPLALYLIFRMLRGDWQDHTQHNSLAFQSITLLMATAIFEMVACFPV